MDFKKHSELEGRHAFLGASTYSWLRYDEEKLRQRYLTWHAKERGTRLHALAAECIRMGITLPRSEQTLNLYVNDAIRYQLMPEQVLYYSDNAFGTADAIGFRGNLLRVHDLKTGNERASMDQLLIYMALFCLEYGINPEDILMEARIYQNNTFRMTHPASDEIRAIMIHIIDCDRYIEKIKEEERLYGV